MESASAEPMPKVRELLAYYGGGGVTIHVNEDNNRQNPKAEQEATKTRLKLWERNLTLDLDCHHTQIMSSHCYSNASPAACARSS
ncbi:hypothetical protein RJ640_009849 [Escallonia rubra]|uniref:Uncharacterized protein n=1 Tax=Escallonia rubra TaxID=112253 RepID=A0AA88QHH1_9ASTE|nr:hypothetical protein RJ640_009849 [Escallonia rubra]